MNIWLENSLLTFIWLLLIIFTYTENYMRIKGYGDYVFNEPICVYTATVVRKVKS